MQSLGRNLLFIGIQIVVAAPGRSQQPADDPPPRHDGKVMPVANIVAAKAESTHPLDPALKMAEASLQHVRENVDDYVALFVKRCRINGQLPDLHFARLKIRNRKSRAGETVVPFSVYLKFLKPPSVKGREVIWVEGRNDGKMIAHEGGFAKLVSLRLDPTGFLAMRNQKYPITDIGIEQLLEKIIEKGRRDLQHDECEVNFYKNARIGDVRCTVIEVIHPVERPYFDFHIAKIYLSDEMNLPIRYESWSWPSEPDGEPELDEEYTYLDLQLNVGLTDQDFDPANPEYEFP